MHKCQVALCLYNELLILTTQDLLSYCSVAGQCCTKLSIFFSSFSFLLMVSEFVFCKCYLVGNGISFICFLFWCYVEVLHCPNDKIFFATHDYCRYFVPLTLKDAHFIFSLYNEYMILAFSIPISFGTSVGMFLGPRKWKASVLNASSISSFNILIKETVTFWWNFLKYVFVAWWITS